MAHRDAVVDGDAQHLRDPHGHPAMSVGMTGWADQLS
jgi:hypothetical protein